MAVEAIPSDQSVKPAISLLFINIITYHYAEPEWRGKESVFHTLPERDLSCFRVNCKSAIIITYKVILSNV